MSIRLDPRDGWLLVTLDRPERRNALDPAIYDGLHRAVALARADDLAAIVICGAGGYFCAGGDLNTLAERRSLTEAARRTRIETLHDVIRALRGAPCPVIAAAGRGAAGAGLSLMLACDLVVADEDAGFALSYVRAGLTPDGGALAHLRAGLPRQLVARMALFGDSLTARRLFDLGLVTDLAGPGGSLALAGTLAERLAGGPRAAQGRIKALLAGPDPAEATLLDAERDAMAISLGHDEAAEGIAAFRNRRAPEWPRPAARPSPPPSSAAGEMPE